MTTNTEGYFAIDNLKPGIYTVEITAVSFQKTSQYITIKAGTPAILNLSLKKIKPT